ncbi:ABC transporter ATP-binding protein [Solirhodobacter olei]|uniref:ABC transporter ATP-binding protein n=1 Tax=Solirhodobacter olei TaxID=2493082 RepID=UPI000FDC2594|nr:ABC transporter ATP-binding protein [Solirhodobacter olei]
MTGLEVIGLNKAFGGLTVARDINITLAPGDRKALIGPNGAGKSTFTNLITGILEPTSGEIRLDGRDIGKLSEAQRVKAGIAKTFQITNLFKSLTVRDNLRLPLLERRGLTGRLIRRSDREGGVEDEVESLLSQFRLSDMGDRPVERLAYGQQRLVEMAMTLALKPRILILDEPAAGVPSSESPLIAEAISGLPQDLAVLVIEHDMALVFKVARRIVVLVSGAILTEGTPEEIAADARVRDLYLGASHG